MLEDVQSARSGERAAIGRLVSDHYDRVARFCVRRLGPELGKDAAQETFIAMQKSLKAYRGDSAFSVWLLGVAHRVCLVARRRNKEFSRLPDWMEAGPVPEKEILDREVLRAAMLALSEEHREVVLMHEVEGLSYAEIAEILGVPEGTVKSRLHHAFSRLREKLGGDLR